MGLQVRIRHALGARTIEISGRGPENPIRVGRDGSCDVPVPSGQVAPVHCLLYMAGGEWVLAGAGAAGGLLLNGVPVTEPQFIASGDRITLGSGSSGAVIEIDPSGANRRAAVASRPGAARPKAPTERALGVEPARSARTPAAHGGWVPPSEPQVELQPEAPPDADGWAIDEPDSDEYVSLEAAAPSGYRRRPSRRQQSGGGLAVFIVVVLVALGGIAIYLAVRSSDAARNAHSDAMDHKAQPSPIDLGPAKKPKTNIFDNPRPKPPPAAAPQPVAPTVADSSASPAQRQTDAELAPVDPRKQNDEWRNVEAAQSSLDQAAAIWVFDDYMRRHPGDFDQELKGYIEAALDRLWWERIKTLCDERNQSRAELEQQKTALTEERPDSDYRKTIQREIDNLSFRIKSIDEMLRDDMAYTSPRIPNLFDDAQLAELRGQRDKAVYEKWCRHVCSYVRTHNGKPPWVR